MIDFTACEINKFRAYSGAKGVLYYNDFRAEGKNHRLQYGATNETGRAEARTRGTGKRWVVIQK